MVVAVGRTPRRTSASSATLEGCGFATAPCSATAWPTGHVETAVLVAWLKASAVRLHSSLRLTANTE